MPSSYRIIFKDGFTSITTLPPQCFIKQIPERKVLNGKRIPRFKIGFYVQAIIWAEKEMIGLQICILRIQNL